MNEYKFMGGSPRKVSAPLPEGDYDFSVLDCGEPYLTANGNWALKVALLVEGQRVLYTPWSRSETNNPDNRDGIGDFLLAINCAPVAGQKFDWQKVIGARGRLRLRLRQGTDWPEVHYFHVPHQLDQPQQPSAAASLPTKRPIDDLDQEPDDIPF